MSGDFIGGEDRTQEALRVITEMFHKHDLALEQNQKDHEAIREKVAGMPDRDEHAKLNDSVDRKIAEVRKEVKEDVKEAAMNTSDAIMQHVSREVEKSEQAIAESVMDGVKEELSTFMTKITDKLDGFEKRLPDLVEAEVELAEENRRKKVIGYVRYFGQLIVLGGGIVGGVFGALMWLKTNGN